MASSEQVVRLKSDFYRDGYRKVVAALSLIIIAIILLVAGSIYLYISIPPPVYFITDKEWRLVPPVPIEQPYLSTSDLLQWVGNVMMGAFCYDFVNYQNQIQANRKYFTDKGWLAFQGMLNNYASSDLVTIKKTFINGAPGGAPFIINEGLLDKRYAWWVQIPMQINYTYASTNTTTSKRDITFQLLVVRIPTWNNFDGVVIDNIKLLTRKTDTAIASTPNA